MAYFDRAEDLARVIGDLIRRVDLLEEAQERLPQRTQRVTGVRLVDGVEPTANDTGRVGRNGKRFAEMWAKEIHADEVWATIKGAIEASGKTFVVPDYFIAGENVYKKDVLVVVNGKVYRATPANRQRGIGVAQEDAVADAYVDVAVGGIATVVADAAIGSGDPVVITDNATAGHEGRVKSALTMTHTVNEDEESAHTHTNPATDQESAHTHTNPDTGAGTPHQHTNPVTGGPSATLDSIVRNPTSFVSHSNPDGYLLDYSADHVQTPASGTHTHSQGDTGLESSHTHPQGDTGPGSAHQHTQGDTGPGTAHKHNVTVDDHERGKLIGKAIGNANAAGDEIDILLTLGT